MSPESILYPGLGMFALTASVIGFLGISRYRAVSRGDVNLRYYRLYNEGQQTERLQQIGRHAQNHFEVPPLFYITLLFIHAGDSVSGLEVALAWIFVALRCLHTFIHLGRNDVRRRFQVFVASGLVLIALWACLAASLLG